MFKSILVATDGSALSDAAIKEAASLAKELGSKLVLFYAAPRGGWSALQEGGPEPKPSDSAPEDMGSVAEKILASAARNANLAGLPVEQHYTVSTSPHRAIVEAAKKFQCELIIIASHARRGFSGVLLGSETEKLLSHSNVPVIVVHRS